jgi:hypothetical protein
LKALQYNVPPSVERVTADTTILFLKGVNRKFSTEGTVNLILSWELKLMATACFVIRLSHSQSKHESFTGNDKVPFLGSKHRLAQFMQNCPLGEAARETLLQTVDWLTAIADVKLSTKGVTLDDSVHDISPFTQGSISP